MPSARSERENSGVCFSAHALQTTVSIYSIDKPAKRRVFVDGKPKACVYYQCVRASNPVEGVRRSQVGSTPAAFRQSRLPGHSDIFVEFIN
jgi:hypothetical protein